LQAHLAFPAGAKVVAVDKSLSAVKAEIRQPRDAAICVGRAAVLFSMNAEAVKAFAAPIEYGLQN